MMHQPIRQERQEAPNYIVYLLGGDGKIRGSEWIAAISDDHALAQVRALGSPTDCELWQRDRKIGRIEPPSAREGLHSKRELASKRR